MYILPEKSRNQKKMLGQFFTPEPVAEYMAQLMDVSRYSGKEIRCLDAGAGSGRLSMALLSAIFSSMDTFPAAIGLDLYEADLGLKNTLIENMEKLSLTAKMHGIKFMYHIFFCDYLCSEDTERYDLAIMNPPYKKIGKSEVTGKGFDTILSGQPNLYFLFIEKMLRQLRPDGEFAVICPRSWTSGLYFRKFRRSFLNRTRLKDIFLFVSRNQVFRSEKVLQETMILHGNKHDYSDETYSLHLSVGDSVIGSPNWHIQIPYQECIYDRENQFLLLPSNAMELAAIQKFSSVESRVIDHGYQLKTGPVVEFRYSKYLSDEPLPGYRPMLRAENIRFDTGEILFPAPSCTKAQYISRNAPHALFVKNQNMLLFRRFASKEENRRIQVVTYHRDMFPDLDFLSLENHVSYLVGQNGHELTRSELYSLKEMFCSDLYEDFYRALDGSTQLNNTEFNLLPFSESAS